jgi:hypothetical protein
MNRSEIASGKAAQLILKIVHLAGRHLSHLYQRWAAGQFGKRIRGARKSASDDLHQSFPVLFNGQHLFQIRRQSAPDCAPGHLISIIRL